MTIKIKYGILYEFSYNYEFTMHQDNIILV